MPVLRIVMLWLLALVLTGCAAPRDSVAITRVTLAGQVHELPMRLPIDSVPRDQPYELHAQVELPTALHGEPVDLSVPVFQAQLTLAADGHALAPDETHEGYRVAVPQRWRIPAELTADGRLALVFTIENLWTQSTWLTIAPLIVPAGARVPQAEAIEIVNIYGSWLAIGTLLQIGLTCLLMYFLDRRRRPYLYFGIQTLSAVVYPVFTAGLSIRFGPGEIVMVQIGLVAALLASVHFTHSYHHSGAPPRWVVIMLIGAGLVSLLIVGPYHATPIAVRVCVIAVAVATGYQLYFLTGRYLHDPAHRMSHGLLITAWLALALGTWPDLIGWFGIDEPLDGVRPAGLGLAGYALCLSLLLSRSHTRSLAQADALNEELEARIAELDAERARVLSLNRDLRLQIADRSAQLFSALSLIEGGDRRRAALAVGSQVDGRYRVERVLGSGAMGMVYEVSRLSDGSRWAMKIATGVRGEDLARLAREAHIASKLMHENVVEIRDIEVSTLGFLYIVLELVEGESLRRQLERGPAKPRRAIQILLQVARGLAAMHKAGVAHRDLKPDNVLVAEHDGVLKVKIADFGISRLGSGSGPLPALQPQSLVEEHLTRRLDPAPAPEPTPESVPAADSGSESASPDMPTAVEPAANDEATAVEPHPDPTGNSQRSNSSLDLTGTGMLAGTPHYVAPELALGASPNDVRGDLYSFGVLAFELLAGERPFAVAVALSLRSGDVPVEQRPLDLGDEHRALVDLVERCLSFQPERRPSAEQLVQHLSALAQVQGA